MHYRNLFKNSATVILLTAGATGLRYLFNPTLGFRSPFLFHVLAIALAAQIAGTISGLLTTGMSMALIGYFFIPPIYTFGLRADPADNLALLLATAVGIVLSLFGGQRKRAEDQLRRLRYHFESAQHIASTGSWESDLVGPLWWSPETYKMFGVETGTSLHTEDFYDLVYPEDRAKVLDAVKNAVEGGTDYEIEHRIQRKSDGEVRLVHQQAKVIHNGAAHLIGSIRDITDKRRGELAQQILGGLLQVCSACRRIRDGSEEGEWYSMEGYLRAHTTARFSHGMCPDCGKQWSRRS